MGGVTLPMVTSRLGLLMSMLVYDMSKTNFFSGIS